MLKVYGASDDLVEIEGDIEEEFPLGEDDFSIITLSNGVVLKVAFTQVGWRIQALEDPVDSLTRDMDESEEDESVIVHDDISWVVCGQTYLQKERNV